METKQTAVEYLIDMIRFSSKDTYVVMIDSGFFDRAKVMEKEQMKKSFNEARIIQDSDDNSLTFDWNNFEKYFYWNFEK